jgi:cell division protein FtsW
MTLVTLQKSYDGDAVSRGGSSRATHAATLLIACCLGLVAIGFAMAASVAPPGGFESRVQTHGINLSIALVAFLVALRTPLEWFRKAAPWIACGVGLLLIVVLIPGFGRETKGARRWFTVGSFSFQPSEIAKFAVILFLADFIGKHPARLANLRSGFLAAAAFVLGFAGIIFVEPDFGTALYIICLGGVMLAIGGAPATFLISSALISIIPVVLLAYGFFGHVSRRTTNDFQVKQSLRALGEGGPAGVGFGGGRMKFGQVPEGNNDFILSLTGEEWGLLGTLTILLLFGGVLVAGAIGSRACRDTFRRLVVFGVTFAIGFQAVFNIAVVTGVAPPKGIALPFVSSGGSALLGFALASGLAVNALRREAAVAPAPR